MKRIRRMTAAILAGIMTCTGVMTGYADATLPACDETLYITLDGAGGIEESSVVKRYEVRADGEIRDYGTYETVSNLTTGAEATDNGDGSYSFPVSAADGPFYFEGKTAVTEAMLPWSIRVRYLLNGVETPAEELAGAKGLVEMEIDLLPNKQASDYYRNNMALTLSAMVNTDEVLSVRAEGAQMQTIGNMTAIVYFALPGEECHYTIAIGSDDFTFTGLIVLMVPLTLSQLDQVGDLREAKETLEDSKDALDKSMDVILDSMEQMQSGIADTATGLRELDNARTIIQSTKGSVYDQADAALEQLDALAGSLRPFREHTSQAQKALRAVRRDVNDLVSDVNELEPKLGDLKDTVRYLRDDMERIASFVSSPQMDDASAAFTQLLEKTRTDLLALGQSQAAMSQSIGNLGALLASLQSGAASLEESTALLSGLDLDTDYDADEIADLILTLQDNVELVNDLPQTASAPNWSLPHQAQSALGQLVYTTEDFTGSTGIAQDIAGMIGLTQNVLAALDSQKATFGSVVHESRDLLGNTGKICQIAEDICGDVDALNLTLAEYHPEALATLEDLGNMTDRAADGIASLSTFLKTLENQIQSAGGSLDAGTKATLNGLADVLDHAGGGLAQTKVLRDAKNTILDTIDDKWEEFREEHTTLLDIDLDAKPVSLTSAKNPSPRSMQIILRTKEITADDEAENVEIDENYYPEGNVFHRIAMIFKRIWETICSLFG